MAINEQFLALAQALPKKFQEKAVALVNKMGDEVEGIGDEPITWRPGYLRIVQATSDRSKLPKNTAIGSLILGEEVLEQPVGVIPIRLWNSRQYWDPDHDANRIICSSPDAVEGLFGNCRACPYSKFDDTVKKSLCGMVKNFLVIKEDLSDMFYVQFSKTNFSNGRDWEKVMKTAGVNAYRRIYELQTFTSPDYKNVESLGAKPKAETPPELNDFLDALMKQFGADRKAYIGDFREMAAQRRASGEGQPALESSGADKSLEHIPEEGGADDSAVDAGAKSYSL